MANIGGARVLGRDNIGYLAPGMSADLIAINCDRPEFAGAHDLVAAIIFCQVGNVDYSFINGKKVVDCGRNARGFHQSSGAAFTCLNL